MPLNTLIPPFILAILAVVSGKIIAKYTHDELKQGKKWFVLLAVLSAIGIIVSTLAPISYGLKMALVYTFSFILLVAMMSIPKSLRLPTP